MIDEFISAIKRRGKPLLDCHPPRREPDTNPVVRVAVRPVEVRLAVVRVHVADVRVAVHGLFSAASLATALASTALCRPICKQTHAGLMIYLFW